MIGPVSETGKTMLASLQGAMSRGMPVDQAITYVKSMAQQGVAPLVDLYALLKQFERLKQQPVQPPQGGSVREQLNMLETGQGAMNPQAGAAAMGQGLGGLNAGSMQNPQFAGGGIVAFQEGGETESFTPELYVVPKSREEEVQQFVDKLNRLPELRAKYQEEMKERGLGKFAPSLKMGKEYAETLGEEAELLPEELEALDREAYYADLAGTKEPDFLSALGAAQSKRVERKRATKKEAAAAKDKARLETILRQAAVEAAEKGDYEALETIRKDLETLRGTAVEGMFKDRESREMQRTMVDQSDPGGIKRYLGSLLRTIGDPNTSEEDREAARKEYQFASGKSNRKDLIQILRLYDSSINKIRTEISKEFVPEKRAELEAELQEQIRERTYFVSQNPELAEVMTPTGGAATSGEVLKFNPETGRIE